MEDGFELHTENTDDNSLLELRIFEGRCVHLELSDTTRGSSIRLSLAESEALIRALSTMNAKLRVIAAKGEP